jgi:high-affinity iron transporter
VAVAAPLVLAVPIVLAVQSSSPSSAAAAADPATGPVTAVTVTEKSCAPESASLPTGGRSFSISNTSRWPLEVYLVKQPEGGVLARTGIVGPGTLGRLAAVLGPGNYALQCLQSGQPVARSKAFTASGATPGNVTPAIPATSTGDLLPATNLYSKYVQATLGTLDGQVAGLKAALVAGDLDASRQGWLAAQQTWQTVGAAYGSFGDLGEAVNALPHGSAAPDQDPGFTGLHRIEYGLYHGQAPATLVPIAQALQQDLAKLHTQLPSLALIPANMPLRAHEILEDALRDHLSGQDDQGSGMADALTAADVVGTRAVLDRLTAVLEARQPGLVQQIGSDLDAADAALQATKKDGQWVRLEQVPRGQQQSVDAAVSAALETLAQVPQLLQLPAGSE